MDNRCCQLSIFPIFYIFIIHYPFFNYQLIKQYEKVIPFTGNSIRMFCLHQH